MKKKNTNRIKVKLDEKTTALLKQDVIIKSLESSLPICKNY